MLFINGHKTYVFEQEMSNYAGHSKTKKLN
jgi:hypothetical protein